MAADDLTTWWQNLGWEWQYQFMQAAGLRHEPDENELVKILQLETIRIVDFPPSQQAVIETVKPLAGLKRLGTVDCSNTAIDDVSALGKTNLHVLICRHTPFETLDSLTELASLREIDFSFTHITSLEPCRALRQLRSVAVNGCSVYTLEPLFDLRELEYLSCRSTKIVTLEPLKYHGNLKYLDCSGTFIDSLEGIFFLEELRELRCPVDFLSEEEILYFQYMHPMCRIVAG